MTEFIEDIKEIANDALKSIDDIGAIKSHVYFVTRTWDGENIGDGNVVEVKTQLLPTPFIRDLSQDVRLSEGGAIKQGDLILRMISQYNYPLETDVDCSSTNPLIERFYDVGGFLYNCINVRKDYATWNVHIRRTKDQKRY